MISKQIKSVALASTLAAALSSGMVNADATIKIGVAGPHTGPYASYGVQIWKGASAAAEEINQGGGINGKMIELVKGDDACEPKQAVAVANRLVDQVGVSAVLGHFCSSSTLPASDIYEEAGIVMITPSSNPKITERGLDVVLRIGGRDDQQASVAADHIIDELKGKRVAVIHDKDSFGQGLAAALIVRMKERGQENVLYEGLTQGEKDFNAVVTKIKSVNADVVYYGGFYNEAGPLLRQMREQGINATFVSGDGIFSDDMLPAAGGAKNVQGTLMTYVRDPRTFTTSQAAIAKFRASGYEPEGYTLTTYSSLQAIAKGMQSTNSLEGVEIANWLKANPVNTVLGQRSWDNKGDLTKSDYVVYRWDENGKYAMIE